MLVSPTGSDHSQGRPGACSGAIEKLYLEIPQERWVPVWKTFGPEAEITQMDHHGNDVTIEALIPMRGLIGF